MQTNMFAQSAADLPLFSGTPVPAAESAYTPEPESNLEQMQLVADEMDEEKPVFTAQVWRQPNYKWAYSVTSPTSEEKAEGWDLLSQKRAMRECRKALSILQGDGEIEIK